MSDNVIEVAVKASVGQLDDAMDRAASSVERAAQRMQQSFSVSTATINSSVGNTAQVSSTLGDSFATAATKGETHFKSAGVSIRGAGEAARNAGEAADDLGDKGRNAGDKVAHGMNRGKDAADLLGNILGVHIPRELKKILAQSDLLGPALKGAFSIIAIAAFIELAIKLGEKLSELISKTFIYTEAQQKLNEALIAGNKAILDSNEKISEKLKDNATIGLEGQARTLVRLQQEVTERNRLSAALQQQKEKAEELAKLQNETEQRPIQDKEGNVVGSVTVLSTRALEAQEKLTALNNTIGQTSKEVELADAKVAGLNKQFHFDGIEDGKKRVQEMKQHMADLFAKWDKELERLKASSDAFKGFDIDREIKYWEEKKKLVANGSREAVEIEIKIAEAKARKSREENKLEMARIQSEIEVAKTGSEERVRAEQSALAQIKKTYGEQSAEFIAQQGKVEEAQRQKTENDNKLEQERLEHKLRLDVMDVEREEQHQLRLLEIKRDRILADLALEGASVEKMLSVERTFEDQRYQLTRRSLERKRALYQQFNVLSPENPQALEALKKLDSQAEQEQDRHNQAHLESDQKMLLKKKQMWDQMFGHLRSGLSQSFRSMLFTGHGFAEGMRSIAEGILGDFIDMLVNMAVAWIEKQIMMKVFHMTTKTEEMAMNETAAAAEIATGEGVNEALIMSNAALAAAVAYAYWAWNPAVAGAMAAGAYSAVASLAPLAMFEQGGIVGADMLAYVHQDEMVLPADLSQGIQEAVNGGGFGGANFNVNLIAMDSKSFEQTLDRNARALARQVEKQLRRMNLS
jgi:hypothetical protein